MCYRAAMYRIEQAPSGGFSMRSSQPSCAHNLRSDRIESASQMPNSDISKHTCQEKNGSRQICLTGCLKPRIILNSRGSGKISRKVSQAEVTGR